MDQATPSRSTPAEYIAALERAGTRRATRHDDVEVIWRLWGEGPPLVLFHGGTGSWLHWVRNIEDLARDFRLLVPDLPGSGESGNPQPPITAERIGATLAAGIATILGRDTGFAIAGFSMGGLLAGYAARSSGARAQCLVLVGSSGTQTTRGEMGPLKSWRRLATEEEKIAAHRRNLGILMIHDPDEIDALAVHAQKTNAERSRVRGKHVSNTGALADCLPGFRGRLAGIWGEYDATAAPYLAERRDRLRQFQPDASFDVIEGAGHWVQYEAFARFNDRLRTLVAPIATGPASA
jgi:2-hydroxy-6-oxonona-2,4-dienedioate hydrolase